MTERTFTFEEPTPIPNLDEPSSDLAREFPPDAKPYREVRYVKKKNGTEMIVTRVGLEVWLPVSYYEKVVENNRNKNVESGQHE